MIQPGRTANENAAGLIYVGSVKDLIDHLPHLVGMNDRLTS